MRHDVMSPHPLHVLRVWGSLFLGLVLLTGCDTVTPTADALLVVEGFLDAGKALPPLTLRHTKPLGEPYPDEAAPVEDAEVVLTLGEAVVPYRPVPEQPGQYVPAAGEETRVPERAPFSLRVRWRAQQALASGVVPPPITIDRIAVQVPEKPVQAVLLDSLRLDSLGIGAEQGYIYPVEVALWWTSVFEEAGEDTLYWVRTQLKPFTTFSSTVVDFFLLPGQILREHTVPREGPRQRRWTGVYAVPVEGEDTPLPQHELKVALLRSGHDYARFASNRDAPTRREPVSNVQGAIGIVAGISVDSVHVRVE